MTLGIGYKGRGFALLLADTLGWVVADPPVWADGGLQTVPTLGDQKLRRLGDRLVFIVSGRLPTSDPPEATTAFAAVRKLRVWASHVNRGQYETRLGTGYYVMVAGNAQGREPDLCVIQSFGGPRRAAPGETFVIGSETPFARETGLEGHWGELSIDGATQRLVAAADTITDNLYAELGLAGCRNLGDCVERGSKLLPGISRPFQLAVIDGFNRPTIREITQ